jgi:hypothetical protein
MIFNRFWAFIDWMNDLFHDLPPILSVHRLDERPFLRSSTNFGRSSLNHQRKPLHSTDESEIMPKSSAKAAS